jgi:hypothetical protein
MGLLDDAIREHLELKRQHGADPGEVERQEREALGEPREEAPVASPDDAEAAAQAPSEPLGDETTVLPAAEPEPDEPEPEVAAPADAAPGYEEDPWLVEEEADAPPPPPTQEHPAPEPPPGGEEDVLEETPEFLQETPEHDRLWFEQKPPRDFDWDR